MIPSPKRRVVKACFSPCPLYDKSRLNDGICHYIPPKTSVNLSAVAGVNEIAGAFFLFRFPTRKEERIA
jgi:hypothetical protein